MPGMSGVEIVRLQAQIGCPVDVRNKAVASADFVNEGQKMIKELGCTSFSKPFQLSRLFTWLDDCKKRIDLSKPAAIMRKHTRYPANIDVVYTYSSDEKLQKGTVLNFSNNGLCLKADTHLMEKQFLKIKTELPNGCKKASVQWIKKIGADLFLAGLTAQ